jgi:hypothetical protein
VGFVAAVNCCAWWRTWRRPAPDSHAPGGKACCACRAAGSSAMP